MSLIRVRIVCHIKLLESSVATKALDFFFVVFLIVALRVDTKSQIINVYSPILTSEGPKIARFYLVARVR